ncbi:ABC transporter ATP-binding protein [Pyruvatibacter mobilis]|uniref:ABC transporter ATP-binding protein n=1 Tax=Pyruvatibacter mobilis TaxID=1712261 RepID=UPI003D09CD28
MSLQSSNGAPAGVSPSSVDTARFVWRYWMLYRGLFATCVGLITFMALLDVALPVAAGRLVDLISQEATPRRVWQVMAITVGITTLYFTVRYTMYRVWIVFAANIMRHLVIDTFERVQRFSSEWHANEFAGATVRKISRGMWAYDTYSDTVAHALLTAVLTLIGLTIMLAVQWPLLGLVVGVLIALHLGVGYWLASTVMAPANGRHMAADSRIGAVMSDAISCNAVVKSFGAEARENRLFERVVRDWSGKAQFSWVRAENCVMFQVAMQILMMAALLGLSTWYWTQGQATPGDVVLALTTFFVIDSHLRHAAFHIRNAQQAINELEDLVIFQRLPLGVADAPDAEEFEPGRGAIAFRKVRFAYANKPDPIYDDFSLEIRPGERVGLVGRSGSGKSTFVKLLQRLHDLEGGQVMIDGQDVARVTQSSLRQAIALVPQDPALFHRSLAENIAYARPDATREEIMEAARRAHADEFIRDLPQGYDTEVGERGVKLSGGERQRIAIARAFLADAPILVLDEATSSLDSHTESLIQDAIEDLMRNRTTILIAHRLSTLRDVDRILVFDKGRITEQGTHAELLGRPQGAFRKLLETQAAGLAF